MTKQINDNVRAYLHSLLDRCIDLNNTGNHTTFDFEGDVTKLLFRMYLGEWTEEKSANGEYLYEDIPLTRNSLDYNIEKKAFKEFTPEEQLKTLDSFLEGQVIRFKRRAKNG